MSEEEERDYSSGEGGGLICTWGWWGVRTTEHGVGGTVDYCSLQKRGVAECGTTTVYMGRGDATTVEAVVVTTLPRRGRCRT